MKTILNIENLHAKVNEINILNGINLKLKAGEVHVIMGTNGAGKSTLASVLMGNPKYSVTEGTVNFNGENLLNMAVDERSRAGVFLAMQYPSELSGISNVQFLKSAVNSRRCKFDQIKMIDFYNQFKQNAKLMDIPDNYSNRSVNEGYSGGEKKKNEIFQMLLLKPKLVILDEIDSGLDVDAVKLVGETVYNYVMENKENTAVLIITHYPRLLEYIKPDYVHIIENGTIVKTGDYELAQKIEKNGYKGLVQ